MDRDKAIRMIEAFYPADSKYPSVARFGQHLLEQAQREIGVKLTWRNESTRVLIRYAELCSEQMEIEASET